MTLPPQQRWAVLGDPARWPEWNPAVTAVSLHGTLPSEPRAITCLADAPALKRLVGLTKAGLGGSVGSGRQCDLRPTLDIGVTFPTAPASDGHECHREPRRCR